jgi:acetyltransferase-like isoleucine patch superfamily enzyme
MWNPSKVKIHKPETCNISEKAKIGGGTVIHAGVHVHDNVVIGKKCKIQAQVFIPNGVTIEDHVFVGPQVGFANDAKLIGFSNNFVPDPTLIQEGVKIGLGAKINAGVTIGKGAIIGMGAIVLKDIPAGEVWVGNPAKKIK